MRQAFVQDLPSVTAIHRNGGVEFQRPGARSKQ